MLRSPKSLVKQLQRRLSTQSSTTALTSSLLRSQASRPATLSSTLLAHPPQRIQRRLIHKSTDCCSSSPPFRPSPSSSMPLRHVIDNMPSPNDKVKFEPTGSMDQENPHLSPVCQSLLERNRDFASSFASTKPDLLSQLGKGQAPKVCWIGCSDSRVPEGSVCQTYPGEIFTIRNVANQYRASDDSANAALTFAIEALGVEDVIIVGHTSCGGITAAISSCNHGAAPPFANSSLGRYIVPLSHLAYEIKQASSSELSPEDFSKRLTTENVRRQIENLVNSEVIQRNWTTGKSTLVEGKVCKKVTLHGWIHDVGTGKLHDLNISKGPDSQ